jgi:hypothetical protein
MRTRETSAVIPGHRAAMSPEPMNTVGAGKGLTIARRLAPSVVVMGSGLAPAARPGMTAVVPHLPSEAESRP